MLPSLARWLKAHDLLAYFVLTFLISWSAWVYVILTLPELDFNSIGTGGMLFMMLGQWGPALSAVLIAAFTRGKPGLKEIFGRLKYRRGSGRWFLAAGFLWVAITLASALWHAQASNQALSFHADQWARIFSLLVAALPLFFWGCEEIGWRGFALPRLLGRWNALISSIILGLMWGAWHLPMFIWNIKGLNPGMPFYIYAAFTVSVSVVMTWLLNHTHGSLLLAIFFHFWINQYPRYQYALLPVEDTGGSMFVMSTLILAAFAILIVVVSGYRSFNRNPQSSELAQLTTSKA